MTDTKTKPKALPPHTIIKRSKSTSAMSVMALAIILSACSQEEQSAANDPCIGAVENAKKLDGSIGGDVAAFIMAEKPQSLSGLAFKDKAGAEIKMSAFESKTTFINLWATWCAPCRAEMPAIEKLHNDMSGDKFTVVPISVDSGSDAKPKAFYDEIGLSKLPFFHDGTLGTFKTFQKMSLAVGLPATVIVDKKGCVLGKLNGPAHWDSPSAKQLVKAAIELD